MSFGIILATAFALAMDAFAVSVGISLRPEGMKKRQIIRLAFHFGFFQSIMCVAGWLAGKTLITFIQPIDHWAAFGLLTLIGGKMAWESFQKEKKQTGDDPTKGSLLVFLSVATSIDALAVGISFSLLQTGILIPVLLIGLVAFLLTGMGALVGPLAGRALGKKAELVGGMVLIVIGVKILIDHL